MRRRTTVGCSAWKAVDRIVHLLRGQMAGVELEAGERGGGGSFPRKAFQYGFQLGRAPVYLWRLWGAGGLHPPFRTDDGRLVCHVHGGRGERGFHFAVPLPQWGKSRKVRVRLPEYYQMEYSGQSGLEYFRRKLDRTTRLGRMRAIVFLMIGGGMIYNL